MPAKAKKNAPASQPAAPSQTAEVKVEAAAVSAAVTDAQPAVVEQKEKKSRNPPKDMTGSSVSETRVRNVLSKSMSPATAAAVAELKLLKDKAGEVVEKKYSELSDSTILLVLQHKPKELSEDELKSEEAKTQYELRRSLYDTLHKDRKLLNDKKLTKEDAKALRRMVKEGTIRTGDDAIAAFTATANFVVRELAKAGLKYVSPPNDKRVMKLGHVVNDITSLSSWPLLQNLKCVAAARELVEARQRASVQKQLDKKEQQKKKKADKAAGLPETTTPVAVAVPAAEEKRTEKSVGRDFCHHSSNIIREVGQEAGVSCEISLEVKTFCSDVVYELVCKYGLLIHCQTSYANVKTIKADTITSITTFILTYMNASAPALHAYVADWMAKLAVETKAKADAKKAADATKAAEAAKNDGADAPAATESSPVAA